MKIFREEQDSIGTKLVPNEAYYGVQSLRGCENFKITGTKVHHELIRAMAEIKIACAMANKDAGVFDSRIADAMIVAGREILEGKFLDDFIVDSIQGGAGTSMNMNANEVYKLCKQLFAELWDGHTPLRLIGVALTDLTKEETAQMSLFPDEKKERSRKLDKAYDAINKKFGAATIQRGSNLQSDLRVGKKYQAQMEQKKKSES